MNKSEPTNAGQGSQPRFPLNVTRSDALTTIVPIGLIVACVVLCFVVWGQHHKHAGEAQEWNQTAVSYSNQVATLTGKLAEQVSVNTTLEKNLTATRLKASNDLTAVEATLSTTKSNLEMARDEDKAAEITIAQKDKKIADLESQNSDLDKQADDLHSSIANLEAQIQSTQKKLDADEGDKKLLMTELAHLREQKEDLEKKLTDLAFLKETVRKLKEELAVSRRLDWIRRGIYAALTEKGGERMMHPLALGPSTPNSNTLDVELHQNGGVRIDPHASADMQSAK